MFKAVLWGLGEFLAIVLVLALAFQSVLVGSRMAWSVFIRRRSKDTLGSNRR